MYLRLVLLLLFVALSVVTVPTSATTNRHQRADAIGIAMSDEVVRGFVVSYRSNGFSEVRESVDNPDGTVSLFWWFQKANDPLQLVLAVVDLEQRLVISILVT